MARHEFKLIVTDTELSPEHQRRVDQAVAEAGALALAGLTPDNALTVSVGDNVWWRGKPADGEIYDTAVQAARAAAFGRSEGFEA
jgi:hypothetical protein